MISAGIPPEDFADRLARGRALYARQFDVEGDEVEATLAVVVGERMATELILAAGGAAWNGDDLTARERSLVVIASLVTQGGVEARLRGHLRWALAQGIDFAALESVLILLANYAGQARASVAMELLRAEADVVGPSSANASER